MRFETHEFYLKSAQMAALFPDHPEAIANTRRIAEMIDLAAAARPAPHPALPGAGRAHRRELAARGVRARPRAALRHGHPELQERLDYELGVIISMGYAGYFLIVADFVRVRPRAGHRDHLPGLARRARS